MIKKLLLILISVFVISNQHIQAVPAYPGEKTIKQPDGSELTIKLHGDEYMSYTTTGDGYSVVMDNNGYYVYATLSDKKLVPTGVKAHNPEIRSSQEINFVKGIEKGLHPEMSPDMTMQWQAEQVRRAKTRADSDKAYNYSKFRGLIILVEYNDRTFSREDYVEVLEDMIGKEGYEGYMSAGLSPEWIDCTGSVYDYYYDNSFGAFKSNFDIIGPVKVNRSQYFPNKAYNAADLMKDAVTAADPYVDFSNYDIDGDGIVDMIYFIFAGGGSHYTGNDQRLLWPHASDMSYFMSKYADRVKMGRYACSTELAQSPEEGILEGIGTICHEFSHVLGLEDLYDTDGSGSGGETELHPELWSVMAAGCYINDSRTPAGYSLYERYAIGFAQPQLITKEGEYTLENLDESNQGFKLESGQLGEFFMIENRQRIKWNEPNPGHGMVVYRVDSTNVYAWQNNLVNSNPSHNYYELLRATGQLKDYTGTPFPGSGSKTLLGNKTRPSLRSWTGKDCPFILTDIKESETGLIMFNVKQAEFENSAGASVSVIPNEMEDSEYFDITGVRINGYPDRKGIFVRKKGNIFEKIFIR